MRLIGSLTSPYVRKVRVVLAEKKLEYKLELDDPWSAQAKVVDSNPLGKVPCLVLEGGEALFDSRVIVEYVDTLSPVGRLIPERGRERAEVRTWEALADGIMDAAISARMEQHWPGRLPEQRCQAWVDRQMGKVEAGLAAMARALGQRSGCVGQQLSLADIAAVCALHYLDFRYPELPWRERHGNLAKLADRLGQRPSFVQTGPPAA